MTTKHTPTPWRIKEGKIVDEYGNLILPPTNANFVHLENREANLIFIAKACNYHDRLVLALKEAALVMRDIGDLHGYDYIGDCQNNKDTVFTRIIKLIQEVAK